MTPSRPTPERIEEIRSGVDEIEFLGQSLDESANQIKELLAELDALRADLDVKEIVELTEKNCAAIRVLEDVKKERDAALKRVGKLRATLTLICIFCDHDRPCECAKHVTMSAVRALAQDEPEPAPSSNPPPDEL